MDNLDLFGFHNLMKIERIIFSFSGSISQEVVIKLGEVLLQNIDNENDKGTIARKMFSIFVEMSQNIQRYSDEKAFIDGKEVGVGSILSMETNDSYIISSMNKINENDVAGFRAKCDKLIILNIEELKALRKNTLKLPRVEGKIGGNIGLIDITINAGNPLNCDILRTENNNSILLLSVKINKI